MKTLRKLFTGASIILLSILSTDAAEFDHGHEAFSAILREHVHGASFDYGALKKNSSPLEHYLGSLGAVGKKEFDGWTETQQIAFLINLYNAATLKLVIDHYPVKSIKDIGGLFSTPWKQDVVSLFGEKTTLDHVEHGLLRKDYREPRVHFAVNCASVGCPNLRAEAFRAEVLDRQLDEQARTFLADSSRNRVEGGVLYLSPIFDWFSEDFTRSGSVADYVAPFLPEADRKVVASGNPKVKFTDYDWSLNDR